MTIRQQYEELEKSTLSEYATLSSQSKGRKEPDIPCEIRTIYQRDRDRILHSKSFRRLMHKTQVFLSPEGDHYRTRLTHTLEVTQIARTIARALRLNEDLVEASALGHDLGHTPFGHAGEEVLNRLFAEGFHHSEQSLRVVELIEQGGKGLNLSYEVLNGIASHSNGKGAETLEAQIVHYADKIAYMNHDIDDAVRGGILTDNDIPWEVQHGLGRTKSERITTLVNSLVANSSDTIQMAAEHRKLYDQLRSFMFEAVYLNPAAKEEEDKAKIVVERLYEYYLTHENKIPEEFNDIRLKEGKERAICDLISCMTDRYCISLFEELFVPRSWKPINNN